MFLWHFNYELLIGETWSWWYLLSFATLNSSNHCVLKSKSLQWRCSKESWSGDATTGAKIANNHLVCQLAQRLEAHLLPLCPWPRGNLDNSISCYCLTWHRASGREQFKILRCSLFTSEESNAQSNRSFKWSLLFPNNYFNIRGFSLLLTCCKLLNIYSLCSVFTIYKVCSQEGLS